MQLLKFVNCVLKILFYILLVGSLVAPLLSDSLESVRKTYYDVTEGSEEIEKAIKGFENLSNEIPKYKGLALTYIGSLTAIKARDTFWPQSKYSYAKDGIEIMEQGLKLDSNNIEALFIYGATCYHLPFFFGKGDDAEKSFNKIINLVNEDSVLIYGADLIQNALEFIRENAEINSNQKKKVDLLLRDIAEK